MTLPLPPRPLAEEVPVNLIYGGMAHVVLMATPADWADLARGFSLTEGVVTRIEEIREITLEEAEAGLRLHITLSGEAMGRFLARRRTMAGRTSCGLCGIERLEDLHLARAGQGTGVAPAPHVLQRARAQIGAHQPLHAATGAVHGAFLCDAQGHIRLAREDVGRHNALDKLIGAALVAGLDAAQHFVLITSRCSFEMVEKAAVFGVPALAALGPPTQMALARASVVALALVAPLRGAPFEEKTR